MQETQTRRKNIGVKSSRLLLAFGLITLVILIGGRAPLPFLLIPGFLLLLWMLTLKDEIAFDRRRDALIAAGHSVTATVTGLARNYSIRVNNRCPYVIHASYDDRNTGETYSFKSGNVWTDFELSPASLKTVRVYVQKDDYRVYYVDTESIPGI
jgi:hypothetical protein